MIKGGNGNLLDNLHYIYTDHLNTPREIRNHNNQQRWTWYPETAEAFGANPPNDNPSALGAFVFNLRFPGQLYDPTTQLSYNYYRDYNPRTGRYPTSDPIGLEGGINTYAYVGGNPLSYVDPKGLEATMSWPARLGAAGTAAASYGPIPIGDIIGAGIVVKGIYDMCTASSSEDCAKKCDAAYNNQIRICKMSPTAKGRTQCYARAADLYGECLKNCK